MSQPIASRRSNIASFIAMDVMREAKTLARAGAEIVHCDVGEPGAAPPRVVREAAIAALSGGRVSYTEALGIPALREAIARNYATKYGVTVTPRGDRHHGFLGGFVLGFLAMLDHGGRIGIPNPGYPAIATSSTPWESNRCRSRPAAKPLCAFGGGDPRGACGKAARCRAAMSPANPTGVLTPASEVRKIAEACARTRDLACLGRDLSRPHLRRRGGDGAGPFR